MKEIKLTQNKIALVDDEDYELASSKKWYAAKDHNTYYALSKESIGNGKVKTLRLHRFLLDAKIGQEIDHENGNGLDNRRENLRFCTHAENIKNSHRIAPFPIRERDKLGRFI